jgi:predicted enzyme related to lactoylglutathione lyase
MITEIAFTVYPVADMKAARAFYEQTLGLKLASNFQDEWVEYDVAGGTFAVTTMDMNHPAGAKGALVGFEVDDLDATAAKLKAAGVKFVLENYDTPVCRFAVVTDPSGNELVIHRRKQ